MKLKLCYSSYCRRFYFFPYRKMQGYNLKTSKRENTGKTLLTLIHKHTCSIQTEGQETATGFSGLTAKLLLVLLSLLLRWQRHLIDWCKNWTWSHVSASATQHLLDVAVVSIVSHIVHHNWWERILFECKGPVLGRSCYSCYHRLSLCVLLDPQMEMPHKHASSSRLHDS